MKCNVCGQEFGDGAYCQHCNADRITAAGNYSGGYNAPVVSQEKLGAGSSKAIGSTQKTVTDSGGNDFGKSESVGRKTFDNKNTAVKGEEKYIVCFSCANVIPADSEFCPCCGNKLFVICPKCGHKYSSQYKICNKCGTDRDEYLEELRIQERRRQEEERKKEQERKRQLEEQQKLEQQRREEERRRQEEQRRLEAEHKRQEEKWRIMAERRKALEEDIIHSKSYKEACQFIKNKQNVAIIVSVLIRIFLIVFCLFEGSIIGVLLILSFGFPMSNWMLKILCINIIKHNFKNELTCQMVMSYFNKFGYNTWDSIVDKKLLGIFVRSMMRDN